MHKDILLNKDSSVDWEDVYPGGFANGDNVKDFHSEMEKQMGIQQSLHRIEVYQMNMD